LVYNASHEAKNKELLEILANPQNEIEEELELKVEFKGFDQRRKKFIEDRLKNPVRVSNAELWGMN
jgi:hypothetical protein